MPAITNCLWIAPPTEAPGGRESEASLVIWTWAIVSSALQCPHLYYRKHKNHPLACNLRHELYPSSTTSPVSYFYLKCYKALGSHLPKIWESSQELGDPLMCLERWKLLKAVQEHQHEKARFLLAVKKCKLQVHFSGSVAIGQGEATYLGLQMSPGQLWFMLETQWQLITLGKTREGHFNRCSWSCF